MNVEIQMAEKKEYNRFPFLAKRVDRDVILLFTSVNSGIVLKGDGDCYCVGERNEVAHPVYDKSNWEILPEGTKVILEQPKILL